MIAGAAWLAVALSAPGIAGEVFWPAERVEALLPTEDGAAGAAIIDARGGGPWRSGHLPGAWAVGWTWLRDGWLRTGRLTPDLEALRRAFEMAGVRDDRPVVVVGAGREGWGEEGRIFWTLEYLGHPDVHILDGGMPVWQAAGLPVTRDRAPPPRGQFTPRPVEERRATLAEVEDATARCAAGPCDTALWDAREAREYAGATPYGEPRGGHIPGAVGLWFADTLAEDGSLLPRDALASALAELGITPDRAVLTLCTGGVRSGFAYAVLRELGYPRVANYDGSMWEWSADPKRPLTRP